MRTSSLTQNGHPQTWNTAIQIAKTGIASAAAGMLWETVVRTTQTSSIPSLVAGGVTGAFVGKRYGTTLGIASSVVAGIFFEPLLRASQASPITGLAAGVVIGAVVGQYCGSKIIQHLKEGNVKRTDIKAMELAKRMAPFVGAVITPAAAICTHFLTQRLLG